MFLAGLNKITRWNCPTKGKAILDFVYTDPEEGEVCIDISVTETTCLAGNASRANFVARREREKHNRYPGPELTPVVLDTRGRWGHEALTWVKRVCRLTNVENYNDAVADLQYVMSCALQTMVANQIITASSVPKVTKLQQAAGIVPQPAQAGLAVTAGSASF